MIVFKDYQKYFDDKLIVSVPSLELAQGIYWLKGENGTGKTTMIKSITGLIPFDGNISVGGINIRTQKMAYREIVNYAEAEPLYPAFLTGTDLIQFYAKAKKASESQVQSLIAAFGIGDYADNKTGTYSSGMAKKLSLVLGFMGNPKLILLDEPLITLDTKAVGILQGLIEKYCTEGVSFMITSHQEVTFSHVSPARLLLQDKTLTAI